LLGTSPKDFKTVASPKLPRFGSPVRLNAIAPTFGDFRTFKEQVVYGRIYQTIADVRAAVRLFFERYNAEWLIEKNGLCSPHQTRTVWEQASIKQAA
jgi:hypothetical protein